MSDLTYPELTYPERLRGLSISLARGARCIAGEWNVLLESRVIGRGVDRFVVARERILSWQMHRDAGIRVHTEGSVPGAGAGADRVEQGSRVRLSVGVGPFLIPANCQVVEVVDAGAVGDGEAAGKAEAAADAGAVKGTAAEAGFAYGTLPGHPERGEEAFLVRLRDDGLLVGSVAAFSKPAPWGAALASPLAHRAQRIIARRYLSAMLPRI